MKKLSGLCVATSVLVSAPAVAAIDSISVSYQVKAITALPGEKVQSNIDFGNASSIPTAPIALFVARDVANASGTASASVSASVEFSSTNQGAFKFTQQRVSSELLAGATGAVGGTTTTNLSYYFNLTAPSKINFEYMVPLTRLQAVPNYRIALYYYEPVNPIKFVDEDNLLGIGSISSGALPVGHYEVRLSSLFEAYDLSPGASGGVTGPASLSFNIAAVPEPASWAMMIGGFCLTGAAVRLARQRAKVVTGLHFE